MLNGINMSSVSATAKSVITSVRRRAMLHERSKKAMMLWKENDSHLSCVAVQSHLDTRVFLPPVNAEGHSQSFKAGRCLGGIKASLKRRFKGHIEGKQDR